MKKVNVLVSACMAGIMGFASLGLAACSSDPETKTVEVEKTVNHYYCPSCDAECSSKEAALSHCSTVGLSSRVTVGSEVTIGSTKYYVVSNQLSSIKTASRAAEEAVDVTPVAGEIFDTGVVEDNVAIEKFASDVYVRKFLKELGITKYLQLWAPGQTEEKKDSSTYDAYTTDRFLVVDQNGSPLAEFAQSWDSYMLIDYLIEVEDNSVAGLTKASLRKDKATAFKAISTTDLRTKYEPTRFKIASRAGFDNNEPAKKISVQKVYNYDYNGEVALTKANLKNRNESLDFQTIVEDGNNKARNSYVSKEFFESDEYKRYTIALARPATNEFYGVDVYNYYDAECHRDIKIYANGLGKLTGSTSSDDRQNLVTVRFNRNSEKLLEVSMSKTSKAENELKKYNLTIPALKAGNTDSLLAQKVSLNKQLEVGGEQTQLYKDAAAKTKYTFAEALAFDGVKDYIAVSDTLVKVNGILVPSVIKIKADFSGTADFKGDYLVVTLVPDTSVTDAVVYKLEESSEKINGNTVPVFVKKYSTAFADISGYTALASTGFKVTFTQDKTCTGCSAAYYTQSEADACAATTSCPGYKICPNCGTEFESNAGIATCDKKSGCAAYKTHCANCETEYTTDEAAAACATKAGCPEYTIAREYLEAGATADFTTLTFDSFPAGSLAKRVNGADETVENATFTILDTFADYLTYYSDSTITKKYSPYLYITDVDVKSGDTVTYSGNGDAYQVDGAVFWGKEKNKFIINFMETEAGYQDTVKDVQFAGSSYSKELTENEYINNDALRSYMKVTASGAGKLSITVTSCGNKNTPNGKAKVAIVNKDGKVLCVKEFADIIVNADNTITKSTMEISTEVETKQDLFLIFKKSDNCGQMKVNGVSFEPSAVDAE